MKSSMLALALAAVAASALHTGAAAAAYPDRPIRFIVPYAPGGTSDLVARIVGDALTRELGQQLVIDNRPGAASTLAMTLTKDASPDGYTLAINNISLAVNETLRPKRAYNALKDLAAVSLIGFTPSVLLVNKNVAANSVADLVKLAKSQPGKIPFGSAGAGSSTHLSMMLLQSMAHMSLLHVPYKGGGPALRAMIAGEVQSMLVPIPTAFGQIKAGAVRPLAVTGSKRSPALPQVPTIIESGVPGYEFSTWYGLIAPRATPKAMLDRLSQATAKVLAAPEVSNKLQQTGLEPQASTPEEFSKFLRADIEKWRKVIETAGIPKQQ